MTEEQPCAVVEVLSATGWPWNRPSKTSRMISPSGRSSISSKARIEAHIFIAFLAYCLHVTLGRRLHALAPGLTPRSVLEKFAAIQMIDVHIPTTDCRELVLTRCTEPEPELQLLLDKTQARVTSPAAAKNHPRSRPTLAPSVVPTFRVVNQGYQSLASFRTRESGSKIPGSVFSSIIMIASLLLCLAPKPVGYSGCRSWLDGRRSGAKAAANCAPASSAYSSVVIPRAAALRPVLKSSGGGNLPHAAMACFGFQRFGRCGRSS